MGRISGGRGGHRHSTPLPPVMRPDSCPGGGGPAAFCTLRGTHYADITTVCPWSDVCSMLHVHAKESVCLRRDLSVTRCSGLRRGAFPLHRLGVGRPPALSPSSQHTLPQAEVAVSPAELSPRTLISHRSEVWTSTAKASSSPVSPEAALLLGSRMGRLLPATARVLPSGSAHALSSGSASQSPLLLWTAVRLDQGQLNSLVLPSSLL